MASPVLASDVMDQAAALLNDTGKTLFSYTEQLPYLRKANEDLEMILLANGQNPTQRQVSTVLQVAANPNASIVLALPPSDLFVPIRCWERSVGTQELFTLMEEREWEHEYLPSTHLNRWVFRNNNIMFPPCSSNREVRLDYWRQLNPIVGASSAEEVTGSKTYLAAKTAELCARYIGQNPEVADALISMEVVPARERLESIFVKNSQNLRSRRRRFRRSGSVYSR